MVIEPIEGYSMFRFDEARPIVGEFLEPGPVQEAVLLSAAEAELLPFIAEPPRWPIRLPVNVTAGAGRIALACTDCVIGDFSHVGRGPDFSQTLLFGGDISKLELLTGGDVDRLRDAEQIRQLVVDLTAGWTGRATALTEALESSGVVRLRGLLWQAKLSLLFRTDDAQDDVLEYLSQMTAVSAI